MTPVEFQIAFERELNVFYNGINKPTSDTIFYWLNQAVMKFVKTRYSGTNYKLEAFELSQKRIDDLRMLVTETLIPTNSSTITEDISNNTYSVEFPTNYMFLLGTRVGILPRTDIDNKHLDCWTLNDEGEYVVRYTDPIEVTTDTIDRQLENSLSEHNVHYCAARPLKLTKGNSIVFYTDKHYKVSAVKLTYIKQPTAITLENPLVNYDQLPEHACQEVVKLAVQMYLESTVDQRYTSYSNEVNTME